MIKAGLIGIGFMGRGHLDNYIKLQQENIPVQLTAICDIDESKFDNFSIKGNLDVGNSKYDFSKYNLYTDIDKMLNTEDLDFVDIVLPTYLHSEVTIKALNKGFHVLCEKPMALNREQCDKMIKASRKNNKKLMIGHCLRFWPEYEILKEYIDTGKFGKVTGAYFYRGGVTPDWSYKNWLLKEEKSGGCLFDQHIHDIDMINWLFGIPDQVTTTAADVIQGSGFDIVSTNYIYNDRELVLNAQDDWTLNGDYGFEMSYRVNFEKGNMVFSDNKLVINPENGSGFLPDFKNKEDGYYRELYYFINSLINNTDIITASAEEARDSIVIAEAEYESAKNRGKLIKVSTDK